MPLREHVSTGGTHGVVELKDAVKMGCFTTVLAAVLMCGIHTIYIVYIYGIYIYIFVWICMVYMVYMDYGIYGIRIDIWTYGIWYLYLFFKWILIY